MRDTVSFFKIFDAKLKHIFEIINLFVVAYTIEGYFGNNFLEKRAFKLKYPLL